MRLVAFFPVLLLTILVLPPSKAADEPTALPVWPNKPPGETEAVGQEKDITKEKDHLVAGKRVIRLGNVSKPTITLYRPAKEKDTGTAVVVCPGGGYSILAMDLEGTEVCRWLNDLGVTAVLLKYRVPAKGHAAPRRRAARCPGRREPGSLQGDRLGNQTEADRHARFLGRRPPDGGHRDSSRSPDL